MSGPVRVQRSRTKGWRMPPNTVYVGRPTVWQNPFVIGEDNPNPDGPSGPMSRETTVLQYCARVEPNGWALYGIGWLRPLQGKNLACWCPLDVPCHGDVLLELANRSA